MAGETIEYSSYYFLNKITSNNYSVSFNAGGPITITDDVVDANDSTSRLGDGAPSDNFGAYFSGDISSRSTFTYIGRTSTNDGFVASAYDNYFLFTDQSYGDGQTFSTNNAQETAVCFASGTLIRTVAGDMPVEHLAVGDLVLTASGEARPIRWIGHRTIDCRRQTEPKSVWPILVEPHAFANGMPVRPLWLSPAHAVMAEGHLIQIQRLINGATIHQVPRQTVTYWHVELDSHDLLLAEGLPAESYLDTGNRRFFGGHEGVTDLFPVEMDASSAESAPESCAPFAPAASPALHAARQALLDRALLLGHHWSADPDLHILADGVRIVPLTQSEGFARFALPADAAQVELRSRTWVPAQATVAFEDYRALGVAIWQLQIDGVDCFPTCEVAQGWYDYQTDGRYAQRWTTGTTPLPAGCRVVTLHYNAKGRYQDQAALPLALTA